MAEEIPSEDTGEAHLSGKDNPNDAHGEKPKIPASDFAALIEAIKNEGAAYRKEEQSEDSRKTFREWVTIGLLLCTLAAVGWQVHEMIKVYGPIKEQAAATQLSATAQKTTADNSDRTFIEAQRAWVGPGAATMDAPPTAGKPLVVSIAYQNTGREPARNFVFTASPLVFSVADDAGGKLVALFANYTKSCFASPDRENAGVVFPTTGFGSNNISVPYKAAAIDQGVANGQKMLVVQGCFAYRTFGQLHHSAFCYFFRGDLGKPPNLNYCDNGNNAD